MNVRHPEGVLHSFSIKNIFYDKMDLRLFYFHMTILNFMTGTGVPKRFYSTNECLQQVFSRYMLNSIRKLFAEGQFHNPSLTTV